MSSLFLVLFLILLLLLSLIYSSFVSHVASEVLSVTDEDLTAISFLLDAEDEVREKEQ